MLLLTHFLKPYRLIVALVFLLVFLQVLANLFLPTLMASIVDIGIVNGDTAYILHTGEIMVLTTLAGTLCAVAASYFAARVAIGFGRALRGQLYARVATFSLHEYDAVSTASLITRTTNDTTQVQQLVLVMLSIMVTAPLMFVGSIFLAISQDATLAWVLVGVVPVLVTAILLVLRAAVPLFQALQAKLDQLNLILDEELTGVRVIRAFVRTAHESKRFDAANLDLTATTIKVNRIVALLMPTMMLVLNFSAVVIIWFGSIRVNNGDMQVGALMAFLQYFMQILFALLMISMLFIMLPRAAASAERINQVLAMKSGITNPERVKDASALAGYVEFRDVTFRYPGAEEPALANISFLAKPGQVTAIIGGTGSGKSTIARLLLRFFDVESGQVLVDGVDIREQSQEQLRAKIGFVPQEAVLFSGTIADNIRYGKAEATVDEIRHAAKVAQAAEFITAMPAGLAAEISQGGVNLSGGQKQRLCIARALVRKPEIYVFDDSFSALDFTTDARLRAALKGETRNATVLIVAQRVGTVMDADQILVLDEGRLVGVGTHASLSATSQVYRDIVASQLSLDEAV